MMVRSVAPACLVLFLACGSPAPEDTPPTPASGGESVAPVHGTSVFAVYVVVAEPGAAALEEAAAPLREQSLHVSVGELGCDEGAAEALGAAPDTHAVSVTFDTREDADAFAATLSQPPVGIARVTVRCAD